MSTEFLYREKDGGACGWEAYSLFTPGSFGGGPWALRPKRLQWLNHTITTGFKIAAFRKRGSQNFRARRAFASILHHPQNSDRRKAWQRHPLHFSCPLEPSVS
jgi:hypothetical protein